MGGVWQRLSVIRRPLKPIDHPRWDNSSKARTGRHSVPVCVTASQKLAYNVKDRCLYRALLREATYLPDEATRSYIHSQVRTRFRKYCGNVREQEDPSFESRLQKSRANGRKVLHMLQGANAGESTDLVRVLLLTYGRRGRRRRKLLNEMRSLDLGEPTTSSITLPETRAGSWVNYTVGLTPRLKALAISQNSTLLRSNAVGKLRKIPALVPQIPDLNSWRRPMPLRRVKRMTERWYATLLDRILPPLDTLEWLRLYDLATGKQEVQIPRLRNSIIKKTIDPLEQVVQSRNGRLQLTKDLHRGLTTRAVRRAFQEVFRICPHLHRDDEWKVTWGALAIARCGVAENIRSKAKEQSTHSS